MVGKPPKSNICLTEHTHQGSRKGFLINLISGLIAYCYLIKKPSLNLGIIDMMAVSMQLYVELMLIYVTIVYKLGNKSII
jgi:hypothetical protein